MRSFLSCLICDRSSAVQPYPPEGKMTTAKEILSALDLQGTASEGDLLCLVKRQLEDLDDCRDKVDKLEEALAALIKEKRWLTKELARAASDITALNNKVAEGLLRDMQRLAK